MKAKTYKITAPAMKHREGWKCPKTELRVTYHERIGVPWKIIRPLIACAFRHTQREGFNDLKMDFILRNQRPTSLYLGRSRRCWYGHQVGTRATVFVGNLHEEPKPTVYPKFKDMPEFWHKDWKEHLVGLVAHELWHRWQPGSGKQAEIMCELVESDAIDAYRKQQGYTFTPPMPITQLEAFQQRVNNHQNVFHSNGQPHKGCSVCESLRAPSEECRAWALNQPVGVALGDIPFTEHFLQSNPVPA